ncbi:DUF58 domain-containing protein [Paenibacillus sp. GP183]|uniref:DUF58 domain-containing protein n=1 Tax=Paenibacillus sp. GP183 TaxID=1882751 RepID=UPI00089D0759|nr:DUF58 domain-containing protein [Paenibacillus sp. GP183]SEC52705.1 Uncharacterized conserved protein, DUF58 family, contains vWF domain [Paenibacillus sp. GP183]
MKTWFNWLILLVGCGLAGFLAENRGGFISYYLFFCSLTFLLYAALLQVFAWRGIQVQHHLSNTICLSGEELLVSVQLSFHMLFPLLWLVLHDTWMHSGSGEKLHAHKLIFPWLRRSFRIHYRIIGLQRGQYVLTGSELITGDPFGFTIKKKAVHASQSCKVYPKPADLLQIRQPLLSEPQELGLVRKYVSGDPLRRIHWKSSARLGQLMTKETEQTASASRMLLLDAAPAARAETSHSLLEHGVALAAAFFEAAASDRESCGFACSSTRRIAPAIRQDLTLAYEVLASVGGKSAMSFPDLVRKETALLAPDTSMLCITSTVDSALLRALMEARGRARRVHVICVHDEAGLSAAQREAALQLQALGCSFSAVPQPRSVWPGPGVIADASA